MISREPWFFFSACSGYICMHEKAFLYILLYFSRVKFLHKKLPSNQGGGNSSYQPV